ncbi:MAG: sensor histidine kinase [Bellilinea sp.]
MRNSLIFKLMGAFLLVIAIGALVVSVLTSQATQDAFNLYTTRSGQVWAGRLTEYLAEYYSQTNGWAGVDAFLESGLTAELMPGAANNPANESQGHGLGSGRQFFGANSFLAGQRLVLTDAAGLVISDSENELVGKNLSKDEIQAGAAIIVNDARVGTLFVTPEDFTNSDTLAGEFINSVNRAIISSTIISSLIALLIGALLLFQIIRPIRQLKNAAEAISSGDLNQRVAIRSQDELGQLGTTFNQMAEHLTSLENQRRNLVADIAHELRTPLTAIQVTLEGVQDGVIPMDEEQIAALYAETTLLNRLVGDLKLLSLAEAGQLSLNKTSTDLHALFLQLVERSKSQAEGKAIRLETSIPQELPKLMVDADRITQVVTNLIGNAIYYTPTGGTISMHVSARDDQNLLEVSVSDTGPGIDPEDLPYIFDRFYRTDKSRSRNSGGSGLGLAIAKQLIEAHGGRIWAESPVVMAGVSEQYGTRIAFTLPYAHLPR